MMGFPGPADPGLDQVRHQLAELASRPRCRVSVFTRDRPTDWRPREVQHPESGMPFTDVGAWEFIVECLDSNCPIEVITLVKPEGKRGYVMKVKPRPDSRTIYIKLELGSGKVIGRSFHYS